MRVSFIIFFGLLVNCGTAQRLNIKYRTSTDSTNRLHYLVFTDKSNCKLTYPIVSHASVQRPGFNFQYRVSNDTITLQNLLADTSNAINRRLKESKFIVSGDGKLFDLVSGYTYVDSNLVSDKYDIYSINGKIYRQRRAKTDGYGLVRKDYKPNRRLKEKVKRLNADDLRIKILRGKEAYDKYGLTGMDGVIEITEKK